MGARDLTDEECYKIDQSLQFALTGNNKATYKLTERKARYGTRNRTIFHLCLCTGLRIGSVCRLKIGDIRGMDGNVRTTLQLSAQQMKAKKAFEVDLVDCKEVLEAWLKSIPFPVKQTDPLFYSERTKKKTKKAIDGKEEKKQPKGSEIRAISAHSMVNLFVGVFTALKLEGYDAVNGHLLGSHMMRKTLAARILDKTKDVNAVKEALAQANLSSTSHYLKKIDAKTRAVTLRAVNADARERMAKRARTEEEKKE